jgi:putative ABC transport system substrate-binding protein
MARKIFAARIGFLAAAATSAVAPRIEVFRHGLRELGYIEGKNVVIGMAVYRRKTGSPPRAGG